MSKYKRLTNKNWKENYDIFEDVCCDTCAEDCGECERNFNALVRLAELEDKIENGQLLELPCKVGDTVYCVEYFCNYKGCSYNEQVSCCGCQEMIERERRKEKFVISTKKFRLQDLDRVGKTLFPSKEAAEAKIKELTKIK